MLPPTPLPRAERLRALCAVVGEPVNFVVGLKGEPYSAAAPRAADARRIGPASPLRRTAVAGMAQAAREPVEPRGFGWVERP